MKKIKQYKVGSNYVDKNKSRYHNGKEENELYRIIPKIRNSILKNNKAKAIRFSTLNEICKALDCQPGDVLEYVEDEE